MNNCVLHYDGQRLRDFREYNLEWLWIVSQFHLLRIIDEL